MNKEKRCRPRQLLQFGVIVLVMVLVLALLNWMPSLIQKHRLKRFNSVEAARKELDIPRIYLPTFIPEDLNLAWPPSDVYAQDTPFRASIMHFTFRGGKEIGLIIQQADADAPYSLEPVMRVREKKTGVDVSVRNRKARLVAAVCDRDVPCHQLSWNEGGTIITLTGKIHTREIIRIAGSMLPEK